MKDFYLVSYKVQGIKNLDKMVVLSFYKKTICTPIDTKDYNVKGIYGMNGAGKSGIITSVDILRNILTDENYLNNPMVQKNLDALINKKEKSLFMEIEFMARLSKEVELYKYKVILKKGVNEKYVIDTEKLSRKRATSRSGEYETLIETSGGEIVAINSANDNLKSVFINRTSNLLSSASVSVLFVERILFSNAEPLKTLHENKCLFSISLLALFVFGNNIYIFMDQSDYHTDYLLNSMITHATKIDFEDPSFRKLLDSAYELQNTQGETLSVECNYVSKIGYDGFEKKVKKLANFIQIFKNELQDIDIEKKEDGKEYRCYLKMRYSDYLIDAEFESTGVKKLIKLYDYIQKMAKGAIVFIDEFDSNLHDVYLCALLEYLMDYGEGQLCFTTHNVGPMNVLKKHKKSIDFLSVNHEIYPWTTNGNYSPAKLYINGMIEGSPFNVDSIDFLNVFELSEGEQ